LKQFLVTVHPSGGVNFHLQESKDSIAANKEYPRELDMHTCLKALKTTPSYRRGLIKRYRDMSMRNLSWSHALREVNEKIGFNSAG
jgi:hypothetical protein